MDFIIVTVLRIVRVMDIALIVRIRGETRNVYRILFRKPGGTHLLGRNNSRQIIKLFL
jgi:hypothetical protein